MSESDAAIVGVQKCGCVTIAIARPGAALTKRERREQDAMIGDFVLGGGSILHTTVGEARAMENFLPPKCPHDPKGWA